MDGILGKLDHPAMEDRPVHLLFWTTFYREMALKPWPQPAAPVRLAGCSKRHAAAR